MKPKICYYHWYFKMPWMRPYRGMVLGKFILFRGGPDDISPQLLAHEMAHIKQVAKHGFIGFYSKYLYHYAKGLLKHRSHWEAYRMNPFEVEARQAETDSPLESLDKSPSLD